MFTESIESYNSKVYLKIFINIFLYNYKNIYIYILLYVRNCSTHIVFPFNWKKTTNFSLSYMFKLLIGNFEKTYAQSNISLQISTYWHSVLKKDKLKSASEPPCLLILLPCMLFFSLSDNRLLFFTRVQITWYLLAGQYFSSSDYYFNLTSVLIPIWSHLWFYLYIQIIPVPPPNYNLYEDKHCIFFALIRPLHIIGTQ